MIILIFNFVPAKSSISLHLLQFDPQRGNWQEFDLQSRLCQPTVKCFQQLNKKCYFFFAWINGWNENCNTKHAMVILYCGIVYTERHEKNAAQMLKCKMSINSWNKVMICYQLKLWEKVRVYYVSKKKLLKRKWLIIVLQSGYTVFLIYLILQSS